MKRIWEWLETCELHFCRCHDDYKKRKMISPECDIHDIKLELIELLTEVEQLQSKESPATANNTTQGETMRRGCDNCADFSDNCFGMVDGTKCGEWRTASPVA